MAYSKFPRAVLGAMPRIGGSLPNVVSNNPASRLAIISQHLAGQPQASPGLSSYQSRSLSSSPRSKMSSQPSHPTLLIPGPIEFDDAVLQSMSHYRSAPILPTESLVI